LEQNRIRVRPLSIGKLNTLPGHTFTKPTASSGVKMLHEMRPGEMGGLVISTPVLARYKIGDVIRAFEPPSRF